MTRLNKLAIWMNGHLVGHWSLSATGHAFAYEESWLSSPHRRPISLSMPLRSSSAPYKGDRVTHFFENLLPDSSATRTALQATLGIGSSDPMALLEELGRDCLGALQILPVGESGVSPKAISGKALTEADIAQILRQLPRSPMGVSKESPIRLSLAGNHEKTAFLRNGDQWMQPIGATPTTHIFKLPIGTTPDRFDLSRSVENEWLCHLLLKELGLPVADAEIADFEDQRCLVVTRFDRVKNESGILRLPHEDFCQATGTPSALKYESDGGPGVRRCLDLLRGSQKADQDKETFFKAQMIFWALCAIDGHAKNFSLSILPLGRFQLAPLYDVLSAYPILGHGVGKLPRQKATMAMAVWGKNRHYKWERISPSHWEKTAKDCNVPNCDKLLCDLAAKAETSASTVFSALPETFPTEVSEPILEGFVAACKRLEPI